MSDHDPFNEPETSHPRAQELMTDKFFWDCADEITPFGSDEGNTAYYEWRDWRKSNPTDSVRKCLNWILMGNAKAYNLDLTTDEQIKIDIEDPESSFMSEHWDSYTLDTTIIATCLGQLMDEGKIDSDVKEILDVAITRQSHPLLNFGEDHLAILNRIKVVTEESYVKFEKPTKKNYRKKFSFLNWFKP